MAVRGIQGDKTDELVEIPETNIGIRIEPQTEQSDPDNADDADDANADAEDDDDEDEDDGG